MQFEKLRGYVLPSSLCSTSTYPPYPLGVAHSCADSIELPSIHSFQVVTNSNCAFDAFIVFTAASNALTERASCDAWPLCQNPGDTEYDHGVVTTRFAGVYWCHASGWFGHDRYGEVKNSFWTTYQRWSEFAAAQRASMEHPSAASGHTKMTGFPLIRRKLGSPAYVV